ncbi:MAG: sigma-70 family RNA polymerase sigma factor [Bacteroidota bacterium]|nr:sigma-70 family RNA polymerase sigma factor [Bacteroidota bacterium]MDP4229903.1 sigma-70 family RNA polymerase sigma factor [Bacteroidota bacterium]MDP4237484.1 sigma-70 family RNA polymerase sigma factor [Bacteroidota bacterium]
MQNLPDLEPLIRNTSRGDKRSEERLFGILYKFVHAVIRKKWRSSLSEDEIADIQLDCLEKLLITFRDPEKAEKVLEQARVFGFVHVVAENTAIDYNRKRNRRDKVFISIDEISESEENPNWESKLSGTTSTSDLSDFILGGMETTRMLSELDGKYRQVLEERLGGAEYDEIAEKIGISVANARQIHKRGVNLLRQKLVQKHKSVLSSLSVSQNAVLKRLYMKEADPGSVDTGETTEEEALSAFYAALLTKGLVILLLGIGLRNF